MVLLVVGVWYYRWQAYVRRCRSDPLSAAEVPIVVICGAELFPGLLHHLLYKIMIVKYDFYLQSQVST